MDAVSRVWYNGSYTIAAKPSTTLKLHYTMIQFLIILIVTSQMQTIQPKISEIPERKLNVTEICQKYIRTFGYTSVVALFFRD